MGHAHGGADAVAPFGLSGPAEADVHARVGGRLVGVVVVGQKALLEPAVVAVVALGREKGFCHMNVFSFKNPNSKPTHT